ncbi:hypothetical protein MKX03_001251, partial [Papaver bracteatum]
MSNRGGRGGSGGMRGGGNGGRGGRGGGGGGRGTPAASISSYSSSSIPEVGSSSRSSTAVDLITQDVQKTLTIQEPVSTVTATPPASSKAVKYPARPGFGTIGVKCVVKANHFLVKLADKDLHHYDVSITPEVTSREVNRAVLRQLVDLYRMSHLGSLQPVYDGRKSLYTAGPLPFQGMEFVVDLADKEPEKGGAKKTDKDGKGAFP